MNYHKLSIKLSLSLLFFVFCSIRFSYSQSEGWVSSVDDPLEWVNPLMGTDSEFLLSNGNTYPAIALPFGMNFWTPQTASMGDGWQYAYDSHRIKGIKQTHQPSPWINDYGQFSLLPTVGAPVFEEDRRQSWFSHKTESVKPNYYSVYLADYDVVTEITPTERGAQLRVTYPQTDKANLVIDCFDGGSFIHIDREKGEITGYSTRNSGGVPDNFRNYFIVKLSKSIESFTIWKDSTYCRQANEAAGNHVGAVVTFSTERGEKVDAKIASSFISYEQAALNLNREIGDDSFDQTREKGHSIWSSELSRFKVSGGKYDDVGVFYSCLYRLLLFPRKFYEIDADGKILHYSPYNSEVLPGYMFTDNGFWDTFRAVFPFFTLFYPELTSDIMKGLVNTYKESGWLPEWASPGHRSCMIGSNSASIIAGAYLNGVRDFDVETLYEAMVKNSENEGPLESVGRRGVHFYNNIGYVPYDVNINESAARTLEYAYDDFCIYKMAQELGKDNSEVEKFYNRSQNYKNLFDPETKLMRGRLENGKFMAPFNPFKWGDAFTEGNSWHYTWSVFHDVEGLIGLMGGKKDFVRMLDSIFVVPPVFDDSYYGFTIHEIREMQIMNMGNYAHGNQPVQHIIYLYDYAGVPEKGQKKLREVMDRFYNATPDGYCGDEDNGQTSAWFVMSAMGFYPVNPASDELAVGSPLFRKVEIKNFNSKVFTIKADNNSPDTPYIKSSKLNGKRFDKSFLKYGEIRNGGKLEFIMK